MGTFHGDIGIPMSISTPFYDDRSALQYSDSGHNAGFDDSDSLIGTQNNNFWRAYALAYTINLWTYLCQPQVFSKGVGTKFFSGNISVIFQNS